jgi:hypothetical protein
MRKLEIVRALGAVVLGLAPAFAASAQEQSGKKQLQG